MADSTQRLTRLGMWTTPGVGAAALRVVLGLEAPPRPLIASELERATAALSGAEERGRRAEAAAARLRARWIVRGDDDWPKALDALGWPLEALCVRGSLPGRAVAIVGARACDAEARGFARGLGRRLAEAGRTVLSGGAIGIDAAAHRGALEARGRTVAILGSGLARLSPPGHRGLFAALLGQGGGLLSEFALEESAWPRNFPRRNRLVAALAEATIVVRAEAASGTLHTASAARALGRPLLVRVGGGEGCEALIRQGATPVRTVDDVLIALGLRGPNPLAAGAPTVLGALAEPLDLASLAARLGRDEASVAMELASLLAAGRVRSCGAGRFVR